MKISDFTKPCLVTEKKHGSVFQTSNKPPRPESGLVEAMVMFEGTHPLLNFGDIVLLAPKGLELLPVGTVVTLVNKEEANA